MGSAELISELSRVPDASTRRQFDAVECKEMIFFTDSQHKNLLRKLIQQEKEQSNWMEVCRLEKTLSGVKNNKSNNWNEPKNMTEEPNYVL